MLTEMQILDHYSIQFDAVRIFNLLVKHAITRERVTQLKHCQNRVEQLIESCAELSYWKMSYWSWQNNWVRRNWAEMLVSEKNGWRIVIRYLSNNFQLHIYKVIHFYSIIKDTFNEMVLVMNYLPPQFNCTFALKQYPYVDLLYI